MLRLCSLALLSSLFFSIVGTASAQIMEAPVTLNMTVSFTGPVTAKTSSNGTNYKAALSTLKFTNKDLFAALKTDGVIATTTGWKLVARWTAGAMPEDYDFWLTHPTLPAVPLNTDDSPTFDLKALAAGYSERVQGGDTVSGNGNIKFYTAFSFGTGEDEFQLGGVGTGSYTIAPRVKGGAPAMIFSSLKLNLLGGLVMEEGEGVLEMTLSVGAPNVLKGTEDSEAHPGGLAAPAIVPPPGPGGDTTVVSPSS